MLQETPWVMEDQNEAQKKKNRDWMFDMEKKKEETDKGRTKEKKIDA